MIKDICNIPNVTVTTWSSRNVVLAGPSYKKYLQKTLDLVKQNQVASIIGQPGMGKTTILRKLEQENAGFIYLDMANMKDIGQEFWSKIDREKAKMDVFPIIKANAKRLGYSFFKKIRGVPLQAWISAQCGKFDDKYMRIYCLDYQQDFEGMIHFLSDIKELWSVGILIDEVREIHIPAIHRLINAGLEIPLVMAIPTDVYSKISDLAIRRRLDESRISLDNALTPEDLKEIVDAYCHGVSEEIYPLVLSMWRGRELNTVSSVLQFVKREVEKAGKECEDLNCVKMKIKSSFTLNDVESQARELEKVLRETLQSISKELGITYVHPRSKRVEAKDRTTLVGIALVRNELAYLGVVRLFNGELNVDKDLELLGEVNEVDLERKKFQVGQRFVITNSDSLNLDKRIKKIVVPTMEIIRILEGDGEMSEELAKAIFKEFNLSGTEEVEVQT
ncbi:ATPase AAA [Candidatus Acidianus copahuensis]|uniref:ATPase AAA n=1 Tax=Candidatus Acidianus copahuensis TaxID=1160895 RepID=UPI00064E6BC8|nr:ATPase AAA [Candidatus Acidianus copahuensis]